MPNVFGPLPDVERGPKALNKEGGGTSTRAFTPNEHVNGDHYVDSAIARCCGRSKGPASREGTLS